MCFIGDLFLRVLFEKKLFYTNSHVEPLYKYNPDVASV